jgi:hypothetical protein
VFDGVRMGWTGRFKKFLEIVFWLSRLALEISLSGHDILLGGVIHFLVIVVVTGSDCDPSGEPLLPLFAALGSFLGALACGFGRCCPTTVGDHFPIA